jgi:glutaredoxin
MKFEIYSKENCSYCYKVKQVLELTGKNFIAYELNRDFSKEEFILKFGDNATFPQVFYDSKLIGGAIETIQYIKNEREKIEHK